MMRKSKLLFLAVLAMLIASLAMPMGPVLAADGNGQGKELHYKGKVTPEERKAAGKRFQESFKAAVPGGMTAAALTDTHVIGADGLPVPHYFGPYPNYALSPLPSIDASGSVVAGTGIRKFIDSLPQLNTPNTLGQFLPVAVPDTTSFPAGGNGYTAAPVVSIVPPATPGGVTATATATVAGGKVTAVTITNPGSGYTVEPAVTFSGGGGSGAFAMAQITGGTVSTINLVGSDYYEIALVQYEEKMHTDLPPTRLRGYVQEINGVPVTAPHYLGPVIVAHKDVPVRIKFTNRLPTGTGGDLFIPVDTTVMGAGMGPAMDAAGNPIYYTENRGTLHLHGGRTPWISDGTPHQWITPAGENTPYPQGVSVYNVPDMPDPGPGAMTFYYTNQQSARFMFYHDHSFGITRLNVYVGEAAGYLLEDDVEKDLVNRGIIPADQIPLIIQDKTFVPDSVTPYTNIFGTFASQMDFYDPTWDRTKWGDYGDLWYPHVYMPVQNPYDVSGINAFGRWHYGPWFWPPVVPQNPPVPNEYANPANPGYSALEPPYRPGTPSLSMGMESFFDTPVVNGTAYPYLEIDPKTYRLRILNAANDRFWNLQLYEAENLSVALTAGGSGYSATPTVTISGGGGTYTSAAAAVFNGVITGITVTGAAGYTTVPTVNITDATGTGAAAIASVNTEVKMVPATAASNLPADWPADGREMGVPDPALIGPQMVQIGTEGGFLPQTVVHPNRPISWNLDQTTFNFGNVNGGNLIMGPAERADVIVDFAGYAGKTLILYNDSPAPFPAWTPQYDYYTGAPDLTDTGGSPGTLPGYGPNTRTVMQIRVRNLTPADAFNKAALDAEFNTTATQDSVFKRGQENIIVGQSAYDAAYGTTFPSVWPNWGVSGIGDTTLSFQPPTGALVSNFPMQPKAIQDEMGEAFDVVYGRMSGFLGLEKPQTVAGVQNFVLYPYLSPPTEIIATSVYGVPIGALGDGTQIWKITHNGVDTHPIHFHMFDVQIINRVGWDNGIRLPDPNELGWKDTIRISPLEDTIVALRPAAPSFPFAIPNSMRLIDPTQPEGVTLAGGPGGFFDPLGNPIAVTNHYVNFGWEHVWHCHILSHEEMDMMHGIGFAVPPKAPSNLAVSAAGNNAITVTWTDNSSNESGFTVQRAADNAFTQGLVEFTIGPNITTFNDTTISRRASYWYRVYAVNTVGDTLTPGFPTVSVKSDYSNAALTGTTGLPAAPTNLTAALQAGPQILLTWTDNANNETVFAVERSTNGGAFVQIAAPGARNNTGSVTYTDTTVAVGNSYSYRVKAVNTAGSSAYSNTTPPIALVAPVAPSNLTAGLAFQGNNPRVTLAWVDNSNNETSFVIQRATNAAFTNPVNTTLAANTTSFQTGNLARNTDYYFRIRAVNNAGQSAWVNAVPFPIHTP